VIVVHDARCRTFQVRSVFMIDSVLNLGRDCPRAESHAAAQAVRAARGAREHGPKARAQALTARTCDLRSHECLFYGGSNALDKTGCSISRPYPDMRSW
jgi:hypothetical protein